MGFGSLLPSIGGDLLNAGINLYEGHKNRQAQRDINRDNANLQREFAQHGVRWKIEDAASMGIHPLAALGASGSMASPSGVAYIGEDLSRAGQNISRAMSAGMTKQERQLADLSLEEAGLRNEYLREQIASERRRRAGTGPAFPSDTYLSGQGDTPGSDPRVVDVPLRRTFSDPFNPSKEAGAIPDWQIARTSGGYALVPAGEMKQRIEDNPSLELQWQLRNMWNVISGKLRDRDGNRMFINPFTGELRNLPFQKRRKQ